MNNTWAFPNLAPWQPSGILSKIRKAPPAVGGTMHVDHSGVDSGYYDVYIENWGDQPIFARIRLREYMETGPEGKAVPFLKGAKKNDPSTWGIHAPSKDANPSACDTGGESFHEYWKWEMGGRKHYYPAPDELRGTVENGNLYIDGGSPMGLSAQSPPSQYGKPVQETLGAAAVTMDQWIDFGRPVGEYWVLDADGWAYWADSVAPGTATGLLLNGTELIRSTESEYRYSINVESQIATKSGGDGSITDYTRFGAAGWTEDGKTLMELITGSATQDGPAYNSKNLNASVPVIGGRIYLKQGGSADLGLSGTLAPSPTISVMPSEVPGASMVWDPESGSWSVRIDETAEALSSFTLTLAEETEGGIGMEASVKAIIIPGGANGVVAGRDGLPILDYGDGSYRPIHEAGNGKQYLGCWMSGSDLSGQGFSIGSGLPIVNEVVYLRQGQSFGLKAMGMSPNFTRIAGNFPVEAEYYSITGMLSHQSCTVAAKENAPVGSKFMVYLKQQAWDGTIINDRDGLPVVIVPKDAEGVVTGGSGKVYVSYGNGVYQELDGETLGPEIGEDGLK